MELYLLRHGLAAEPGAHGFADDFARPLTSKGRRQLRKTAGAIKKLAGKPDLILSSPLVRAKQTAEIVAAEMKIKRRLKYSNALAPGGVTTILMRQLTREKPAAQKLMLVGHEPDLSRLLSLLTTGDPQMQLDFKKGGLAKLEVENLRAGKCARLVWLLTPKHLKALA